MKFSRSTSEYEDWLGKQLKIDKIVLAQKHRNMCSDPFIFLRATFYRWAQIWTDICSDLADAPLVLAVGDLHIENFGTWRDAEGRLIWGVNDFDEAFKLPYTNDLLRLATSAKLASASNHLSISFDEACHALLSGYKEGFGSGGLPFVLGEKHPELRKMAIGILRDPVHFWSKLDLQIGAVSPDEPASRKRSKARTAEKTQHGKLQQKKMEQTSALTEQRLKKSDLPKEALEALVSMMPDQKIEFEVFPREAGQGSLGRERYVGITDYRGGRIAREVKALAPSACTWAAGKKSKKILYQDLLDSSVRCKDPFVELKGSWVVRRLAPDCSRIDLSTLPEERDELILLHAMGFELANLHLGSKNAAKIVMADLARRTPNWLATGARAMATATEHDWKHWREKRLEPNQ